MLEKTRSLKLSDHIFFSASKKPAYLPPTIPKLFPSMVETELAKKPARKQKQPISVPFIWETKLGILKNNWKQVKEPFSSFPMQRTEFKRKNKNNLNDKNESKYEREMIFEPEVESFNLQTEKSFNLVPLPTKEIEIHSPLKKPIPFPSISAWNENESIFKSDFETFRFQTDEPLHSFRNADDGRNNSSNKNGSEDERETTPESDSETLSFHTDDSFDSVFSLLANRLVPSATIAHAVPVLETPPGPWEKLGYESDSSTSSYMTGTTSLVGAPFLERLFPLLSPKLSVYEKVGGPEEKENRSKNRKMNLQIKDSVCERGFSVAMRRPTTLEDLIMMSRRRSYIQKAVPIRRHDSLGSTKEREIGCFLFGKNDRIEELQKKMKRQLQLKLI